MRAVDAVLIFLSSRTGKDARMRVLIVEDELKMASLIRRGLVEEGHAADVARTGEDALWMAEAAPYDAVVLDVNLPYLDGPELCRRIKSDPVTRRLPVLILTAATQDENRQRCLDAGADADLTKPFSPLALLDLIDKHLGAQ